MPEANVIVTSNHGFSNTWMAINANYVLETLGLFSPADLAGSKAVAYWAGGTAQIYINLQCRNPGGVVAPENGDVVVFSAPPFQLDAPSVGETTALVPIFGQHGFVPDGDPDRFATFAAAGPHIRQGKIPQATALDLAPTVAHMLGIASPTQSEGEVLKLFQPELLPLS